MSQLALYSQFNLQAPYKVANDFSTQSARLAEDGILFEQWPLLDTLPNAVLDKDQYLRLYAEMVDRVKQNHNFLYADLVKINNDSYGISMRARYISEHSHVEDEARFFLSGKVLVYIHVNQNIHILECGPGDFLLIPKSVKHWMDVGPAPEFSAIRWYSSQDGLEINYTGSFVAESTPRWETIYAEHHFDVDN